MKMPNCPFCGEKKTQYEFVGDRGEVKRDYVCMNSGCFSDPFAGNSRGWRRHVTPERVIIAVIGLTIGAMFAFLIL